MLPLPICVCCDCVLPWLTETSSLFLSSSSEEEPEASKQASRLTTTHLSLLAGQAQSVSHMQHTGQREGVVGHIVAPWIGVGAGHYSHHIHFLANPAMQYFPHTHSTTHTHNQNRHDAPVAGNAARLGHRVRALFMWCCAALQDQRCLSTCLDM